MSHEPAMIVLDDALGDDESAVIERFGLAVRTLGRMVSRDEIAALLTLDNIRGRTCQSADCGAALWIASKLDAPPEWVVRLSESFAGLYRPSRRRGQMEEIFVQVTTPGVLVEFIEAFDDFRYPALLSPDEPRRRLVTPGETAR